MTEKYLYPCFLGKNGLIASNIPIRFLFYLDSPNEIAQLSFYNEDKNKFAKTTYDRANLFYPKFYWVRHNNVVTEYLGSLPKKPNFGEIQPWRFKAFLSEEKLQSKNKATITHDYYQIEEVFFAKLCPDRLIEPFDNWIDKDDLITFCKEHNFIWHDNPRKDYHGNKYCFLTSICKNYNVHIRVNFERHEWDGGGLFQMSRFTRWDSQTQARWKEAIEYNWGFDYDEPIERHKSIWDIYNRRDDQ